MRNVRKFFFSMLLFMIFIEPVFSQTFIDSIVVTSPCMLGCIYHSTYSSCRHSFGLFYPDSVELIDNDGLYTPYADTFLLDSYPAGTHLIFYMNIVPGIGPCDYFTRLDTSAEYCRIYELDENHWELAWEDWSDHSYDDIVFEVFCADVCTPASAIILCGPCGGITGCFDQEVSFIIADSTGAAIDTSRMWFTIEIHHSSGEADTIDISPPSDSLRFDYISLAGDSLLVALQNIIYESGDSVALSLDSLYNEHNCITIFH